MKATAVAPSNIAFVKYWGKKDARLKLPENGSISMNLSELTSTTTVEFDSSYDHDRFFIDGEEQQQVGHQGIFEHIQKIREMSGLREKAMIQTKNTFPMKTGLSSSASGYAALTLAATKAAGLDLSEKELSILARKGSGSSCRSIPDGYVEWQDGSSDDTSYAVSLYPSSYWDVVDIVALVSREQKEVSSTEGQMRAGSSLFYQTRLTHMKQTLLDTKDALNHKDFTKLGEIVEREALELHAIMMTSYPSLFYWTPQTVRLIREVFLWRKSGIEVYFTINTGQDVHLIMEAKTVERVQHLLSQNQDVQKIFINTPTQGAHVIEDHIF